MATSTQSRVAQKEEVARIVREKCRKVRHDKQFSEWKLLVGSTDWKDHAAGTPGAARYRVENLPEAYFGAGVYELGLVRAGAASASRRIRGEEVTVVYVGQAENIRQRLQQYGKDGSHLGATMLLKAAAAKAANAPGTAPSDLSGGAPKVSPLRGGGGVAGGKGGAPYGKEGGIFELAFSSGYAVVFRWSKVVSKEHAKAAETALLGAFDYPWNVCLNGARRLNAIPAQAPSKIGAATKRVTAPCLYILDPVTAVTALGGAVTAPVGPTVAYLHHPSSDLATLRESKHPGGGVGGGPAQATQQKEGRSGNASPLPGWLVSTYGVRQPSPPSSTLNSEASAPHRTYHSAQPSTRDNEHHSTFGGWCDDEAAAPYGGWLDGGVPASPHPSSSMSRPCSGGAIQGVTTGASSVDANVGRERQGRGGLRQEHYSTLASPGSGGRGLRGEAQKVGVVCMAPLSEGGRCQVAPLKGRKRCPDHKGMRVAGL